MTISRIGLVTLAGAAISFGASSALAQSQPFLEEIVVTAQKREQNLQDVPVAVTAYTGSMLQDAGIQDIRDLAAIAPTLRSNQSQNSTTSSFGIRGIGTSSQNFGLESSVGIYVDGTYRARQSSVINDLADIDTIEVLRGPQGTLFGKNTPSGALNIRTVKPGFERDAFVELTAGDFGLINLKAASNFTIKEDVAAVRATVFTGHRDGVVSDVTFGNDVINDRKRYGGRVQLYLAPSDNWDLRLIADYSEIDEVCCAALTRFNNFQSFNGTPGSDAFVAFGLGLPVIRGDQFDDYLTAFTRLPRSTNQDGGLSMEINVDVAGGTFTSITAARHFDSTDDIDADFSAADLLFDENIASQESFSQEFRFSGEIGETGNFVVGAYYFQQDLDNASTLTLGADTEAFFALDPTLSQLRGAIDGFSAATGGAFPVTATAFPNGATATDDMRQDHESVAIFAQADWALSDAFTLTAGLRYTDESKEMNYSFLNSALGPAPDLAPTGAILTTLFLLQNGLLNPADPADAAQIVGALGPTYVPGWGLYTQPSLAPQAGGVALIDDDQVTGTLKLSWFASDNSMLYMSYGTGYKSGGTNTDRINPVFPQTFGPETSTAIEIGAKLDFPNQNLRANIALHDTEIEDLQTNAFSGTGFNLQNAGVADTYVIEVELLWLPTENLDIQLSYAYNVADLQDFELGTCWVATPFLTGQADPGQGTAGLPVCNRSGGRVASNPEHNLYLGARQEFQLGSETRGYIRGEYTHVSDTITDGNNDPLKLRDSFDRVNLRVGVIFESIDAEFSIWGRNLTDERFYETVFDVPVQDGKLNAYPHDPRSWGITFRKNFQ